MSRIAPGRDDTTLVKPASEIDHNLASTMVINHLKNLFIIYRGGCSWYSVAYLKLADVAVLHHHSEETDDHLGAGPAEKLSQIRS